MAWCCSRQALAKRDKGILQVDALKGPRHMLTEAFIRSWPAPGEPVIQRVRAANPVAYCKARVFLVPKDVSFKDHITQPSVESHALPATKAWLERLLSEKENSPGGTDLDNNSSEPIACQVCSMGESGKP
ncbi:MAG TPA: hypothetical protein VKB53_11720 [Gammaproteobacteria bacterium]|nr:hypothetical protein [Gammaproteobacteria bacterium]